MNKKILSPVSLLLVPVTAIYMIDILLATRATNIFLSFMAICGVLGIIGLLLLFLFDNFKRTLKIIPIACIGLGVISSFLVSLWYFSHGEREGGKFIDFILSWGLLIFPIAMISFMNKQMRPIGIYLVTICISLFALFIQLHILLTTEWSEIVYRTRYSNDVNVDWVMVAIYVYITMYVCWFIYFNVSFFRNYRKKESGFLKWSIINLVASILSLFILFYLTASIAFRPAYLSPG